MNFTVEVPLACFCVRSGGVIVPLETTSICRVFNDELFVGCEITESNKARMEPLQVRLAQHIKLYSRVVPYLAIQQKCEEAEKCIVEDNTKFCQKL